MLSIGEKQVNSYYVVTLEGRIDATTSEDLETHALMAIENGNEMLIIDLTSVSFISSCGLRVLLTLKKNAESRGGFLKLCGVSTVLNDIFEICGFSKTFNILHSLPDAL